MAYPIYNHEMKRTSSLARAFIGSILRDAARRSALAVDKVWSRIPSRLVWLLIVVTPCLTGSLTLSLAWAQDGAGTPPQRGLLGVGTRSLSQHEAGELGWSAPRGAKVVKVLNNSPAAQAGLSLGDVLLWVDDVEIERAPGFQSAIADKAAGAVVKLRLWRGGAETTVNVTLAARPSDLAPLEAKAPDGPQLMFDTGGHTAPARSIVFTPDGGRLVSASDDKTIRVWDVATGKTARTLRGEAAPGGAGQIFAMALSADGRWMAAAGHLTGAREEITGVRLYDFASGAQTALLKGHEAAVYSLAFSPDGRHLVSGGGDNAAIIWDVAARKVWRRLEGHRDFVTAVAFTPDGARAVTASKDHDLRLWSVEQGVLLERMQGHGDKVTSLAVAPDGRIASGDWSGEIRLWDGRTGAFLKTLARRNTSVGTLTFNPDGRMLLSTCGGGGSAPCKGSPQHVYDIDSGREISAYGGHDSTVFAAAISPDGRWAATNGDGDYAIHVWDLRTGARRERADGQFLTLGGPGRQVWAAGFSADGRKIAWGDILGRNWGVNDYGPLVHALALPTANEPQPVLQALEPEAAAQYPRAAIRHDGWLLNHRKGGEHGYSAVLDIFEGETVRASIERDRDNGLLHYTYCFTPDGETIISGGMRGVLAAYDRDGKKLGDFIGHDGAVLAATPSPDGRYLVSGSNDQTVRLWNLKTRELLVTLFHGGGDRWVMWTPQGYYAASDAGANLIGWQINHGPENAAEYVASAQFRDARRRPDVVIRAIQLISADAAR